MSNIAWFKDLSKKDIPSVGGKGANLGEMFNNHFPVPPGFVVTAQAFKEFLDQNRLQEPINGILNNLDINDNEQLQDVSEKIQELILNAEMPIEIKNEIINSYEHLNVNVDIFKTASKETINMIKAGRSLPYVAVRSSATAEDLPSISKDEHILIKINDRAYFRKMEEVYELIGCCKDQKVEIPAMENNKIKWMKVESLYKHKANNDKLYKIITKTGREIIVSPNHTLIVLDETTLNPKKVKSIHDLKGNEKLPVINHLPNLNLKNETINILDYIKGQDIVKLNNELKIKNNSSNWKIQNGFPKQIKITSDLAYFLGLYCAEGTIYKNNQIIITNKNEKVIQKIIDYISNFGLYNNQKINKNSLRFYNKILARFLKEVAGYPDKKISGKGNLCRNKKVPEFIFGWNSFLIGEFLKGCFDGDGHAGRVLEYCSTSKLLISGIIKLLELLGIEWYLRKKENAYVITIKSHHYEKFSSLVGFYIDEKQNKLNDLIKKFNSQQNRPEFLNTISITPKLSFVIRKKIEENLPKQKVMIYCCPYCSRKLNLSSKYKELDRFYCKPCKKMFYGADAIKKEIDLYINYDKNGRFLKDSVPWNKSINSQKKSMKKLKNDLEKNNINFNVFDNSVKWDEIEKIKEVDYNDYVYDFSVPEVQNFAAGVGGIITHNSASFAGQQATYLNVRGNERVAKAVQQCWASLYKARAIYYREKNNFEHEKVLIAVIVQKMINSEKAGVAFSINPTTNNENEIVIEAAYGLGDAVVSGSINPNTYLIDKNSLEIKDKKIADQEWMLIRDENLGRTIKKNVWASLKEKPVMTDDEIKKLAGIVRRIEKHYGKPQDIEFAIEEGRLYIVQARPVTTQKKVTEEVKDEVQIGSNKPILEGLPASPGAAFGRVKIIHNPNELNKIEKGDILVAEMTNPDYVPAMERAAAIVTDEGGFTAHAAIVSRELGIPAVVGTEKATSLLKDGQMITVDGTGGKIYEGQLEIKHEEETIEVGDQPETITKIKVIADLPDHLDHAAKYNPDGVGLVRIEFMIVKGGVHPAKYIKDGREEEYIDLLVDGISKIGERFSGKPVWVRTSDLRSDEYRQLDGGNDEPDEDNPMLGFHGIRRSLVDDGILRAEFKAIKRIHEMGLKNVGIMLPFVISVDEVKRSKVIMREVGLEPLADVDFGVMIETPASVQIIDLLCDEGISFISFGTNDLTQTTLGVDRNNSKLSDLYDEMHPAVLREIEHVVKVCKEKGVETSICGQAGSNPEMAKFLVKVGIDSISPNADAVAKIRNLVAQEEKKLLLEAARQKL
ncbi:MAG: phosphoenolpyruvate synthase [Nanoarchaeota archaeon]|nr:phosphoenolpyruvate synthase [Nanoarchaeota archaeon]MBU1444733.1 phosphoenolpyruvate synthase [Nanoarchaeota archaeon]MBU2420771.1 phosphoenolpyruvate synthase [Nanoarchaeota archaeon]